MKNNVKRRPYADNSSEKTEAIYKTKGPSGTVIKSKEGGDLRGGTSAKAKRGDK